MRNYAQRSIEKCLIYYTLLVYFRVDIVIDLEKGKNEK